MDMDVMYAVRPLESFVPSYPTNPGLKEPALHAQSPRGLARIWLAWLLHPSYYASESMHLGSFHRPSINYDFFVFCTRSASIVFLILIVQVQSNLIQIREFAAVQFTLQNFLDHLIGKSVLFRIYWFTQALGRTHSCMKPEYWAMSKFTCMMLLLVSIREHDHL
jgi:hypothetical protein